MLGYYSEELQMACYPELPPMLNADSPEAVARHLQALQQASYRRECGAEGRAWILRHHHWKPIVSALLAECQMLMAKRAA